VIKLGEIKVDLKCIQLGYDINGYISTNTADELINHCTFLFQTIKQQREEIRELKNKNRVKKYFAVEAENLDLVKKLQAANKEVERLLVVEQAYAAYKKAY
jgi:hypothetical protein